MKNRIISCVLTICIMSTTILFGCASPKAEPENASSNDATAQAESDSQSANEASTSDAPSEAATESESEDTEDDAAKGGGGTPWINSELKENITEDTVVNPKDDFHLYANKDWILANDIPDGYTSWSHYQECGLEVKKQCMELLKDESIDGHDADLIRTYNKLILDWDSRNAAVVTEIQDDFDKILAASEKDERVKGISFSRNFGKEAAIFAGLQAAVGDAGRCPCTPPVRRSRGEPVWRAGRRVCSSKGR